MSHRKLRTSISISEDLLKAIDQKAREEGRTRSDMVCEAINQYFASEEERLLAEGYIEMNAESQEIAREWETSWHKWWPEW